MIVRVPLPDIYRYLKGKNKKAYAWSYLKNYHPELKPLEKQPELEKENRLICETVKGVATKIQQDALTRRDNRRKKKK